MSKNEIGSISWIDLTVENADQIREFYQDVVGILRDSGPRRRRRCPVPTLVSNDLQVRVCSGTTLVPFRYRNGTTLVPLMFHFSTIPVPEWYRKGA